MVNAPSVATVFAGSPSATESAVPASVAAVTWPPLCTTACPGAVNVSVPGVATLPAVNDSVPPASSVTAVPVIAARLSSAAPEPIVTVVPGVIAVVSVSGRALRAVIDCAACSTPNRATRLAGAPRPTSVPVALTSGTTRLVMPPPFCPPGLTPSVTAPALVSTSAVAFPVSVTVSPALATLTGPVAASPRESVPVVIRLVKVRFSDSDAGSWTVLSINSNRRPAV